MIAYMEAVARERASDRGCTGGSEVADDMGPPGSPVRVFIFWRGRLPGARSGPTTNWRKGRAPALCRHRSRLMAGAHHPLYSSLVAAARRARFRARQLPLTN